MNIRKFIFLLALLSSTSASAANTDSFIQFYKTKIVDDKIPEDKIIRVIKNNFDIDRYRQIRAQVMFDDLKKPYVIVYLFAKKYHRVDIARLNLDQNYNSLSLIPNYHLSRDDMDNQPGISAQEAKCPDPEIDFITFAPNDIDVEQEDTLEVAKAAELHDLKTIRLLKKDATRQNYLNYMKCPKLKGNFYDGDANPEVITTYDGIISFEDINSILKDQFQFKVTNIWLACEAFNFPMLPAMIDTAKAQKYAAGLNDLIVGPSDDAATCAMKKALDHLPMTLSFQQCYREYDDPEDRWGFDGKGSDFFSTQPLIRLKQDKIDRVHFYFKN